MNPNLEKILKDSGLPIDGWSDDLFLETTPSELYYRWFGKVRTHRATIVKIDWNPDIQRIRIYDTTDVLTPIVDRWVGD